MLDERDERVARALDVLDDVEVPDLWGRIQALAATEAIEPRRPPRRWPALAAAAAVVAALVGVGLLVGRDEPQQVDVVIQPDVVEDNVEENIVRLVVRGDDDVELSPTAVAGWVTFDIDNLSAQRRLVGVHRLLPGETYDDADAVLEGPDIDGGDAMAAIIGDPLVSWFSTPGDTHTVGVAVTEGDHVVVTAQMDERLAFVPGSFRVHRLRVESGDAGQPPTPTLAYQMIGESLIGPTSTPAGRHTIAVDDGDAAPRELIIVNLRDDANQATWDRWWGAFDRNEATWDDAPTDSVIGLWGTAAGRTVTLDLDPGTIVLSAARDLDQPPQGAAVWLQVDG